MANFIQRSAAELAPKLRTHAHPITRDLSNSAKDSPGRTGLFQKAKEAYSKARTWYSEGVVKPDSTSDKVFAAMTFGTLFTAHVLEAKRMDTAEKKKEN